jgi:hypothetical protein
VELIRIREKGLPKVSSHDIVCKTTKIYFSLFNDLIHQILRLKPVNNDVRDRIKNYLTKAELANNEEYIRIWNMLPSPFPELSLKAINPSLAKEWHHINNGSLTPMDVTIGSTRKIWWKCPKGHEWEATVNDRSQGTGCPYCSGNKVNDENCLQTVNPALVREWHPTKNESLTPRDITAGSHKKAWWKCSRGHEWESTIGNRSIGNGCPYCDGKKVSPENCLETVNPNLAKEWHPIKNDSLTPRSVTSSSNKKVWWQCSKGHEWPAIVNNRGKGSGCPYCSGSKATDENCLQTVNPTLAKQWHPTKNISLTPREVKAGSNKKVWWQCSKGHEWLAIVNDRSRGSGCPYCYRQRR